MKFLGLQVPFTASKEKALSNVSGRGGWGTIYESFSGAWQRNIEINHDSVLSFSAVFACQTLIASDIAKLRIKLMSRNDDLIWQEVPNFSYPVLNRPNRFQNHIQFIESWVLSKLQSGNTYVLLERGLNDRGLERVTAMYVLDPKLVQPLVSDSGDVYYRLSSDTLSGVGEEQVVVPASDIIHDRFNTFFHPLVGLSPIFANGLAATQGLSIQKNSALFFQNGSMPGGILTAPGAIGDDTAARLKEHWETNYSGENRGKVAVLGDGLSFEQLAVKAVDAQLIEQLKWSAEVVCSTYHVPPYKIGMGSTPALGSVQALNLDYYTGCLQVLIESIEALLDEALGLRGEGTSDDGPNLGVELDLDDLLRMDTASQYDVAQKAKGILTLDEQRRKIGVGRVGGGDTIYLQQQDHSLAAIGARDSALISAINTPAANPNADGTPAATTTDIQAEALNGAQITALQGLVIAASSGEIPVQTVEAVIFAAFPLLSPTQVEEIIGPIRSIPEPDQEPQQTPEETAERAIATLREKLSEVRVAKRKSGLDGDDFEMAVRAYGAVELKRLPAILRQ